MLVFRDGRRREPVGQLLDAVYAAIARCGALSGGAQDAREAAAIDLLLRAGSFEAAAFDAAAAALPSSQMACAAAIAANVTDAAAEVWLTSCGAEFGPGVGTGVGPGVGPGLGPVMAGAGRLLDDLRASLPDDLVLETSVPEGFAYYDLHPESFVTAARTTLARHFRGSAPWLVVGIRSIGTTLSAAVSAKLWAAVRVPFARRRFTVRPIGHPFDRRVTLNELQRAAIAAAVEARGGVFVVDEGPGLSGSSLLATAEAVEGAGCPADRIVLLCTAAPDVDRLRAPDAARRWRRFRVAAAGTGATASRADLRDLSGGAWRELVFAQASGWPATWPAFERRKWLTADGQLVKFVGLGPYGAPVLARSIALADAGFGLPTGASSRWSGYLSMPWLTSAREGRPVPLTLHDRDAALIDHLARYIAFRSNAGSAPFAGPGIGDAATRATNALAEMVDVNLREAGLTGADGLIFEVERPVIVDGRLMPHEWLRATTEAHDDVIKVDATEHGDDHFFPGPVDVAWDLAGAIVEWQLDRAGTETLLARYEVATGDRVRRRLEPYVVAYLAFRIGYSALAAEATGDGAEVARLRSAAEAYRRALADRSAGVRGVTSLVQTGLTGPLG